jgi:hypothetical protein
MEMPSRTPTNAPNTGTKRIEFLRIVDGVDSAKTIINDPSLLTGTKKVMQPRECQVCVNGVLMRAWVMMTEPEDLGVT